MIFKLFLPNETGKYFLSSFIKSLLNSTYMIFSSLYLFSSLIIPSNPPPKIKTVFGFLC